MSLHGKVALLFGAGTLAEGYASLFAESGSRLAVVSRGASAEKLAASLKGGAREVVALRADVSDPAQVDDAFSRAVDAFGRIDVVVNGAGGTDPGSTAADLDGLLAIEPDAARRTLDANYLSKWFSMRRYLEYLRAAGHGGTVVNIASMSGLVPLSKAIHYSAAFAAVESLTKSMAYVFGHYGFGRVNSVAVGFVCGEQNRRLLQDEDGEPTPRGWEIIRNTSQHRFLCSEDVAPHVLYLADEERTAAVNGVTLRVDGGYGLIGLAETGWR